MTGARPGAGLHGVFKPAGATSFSVVQGFKARLDASPGKAFKVCHGGVLDPFATGLVLVLVGPATRLFEWLHEVPKTYRATVAWGRETDTGDGGGTTVREAPAPPVEARAAGLERFLGWSEQVPPATSNKRVDGERAYVRAHRGEVVVLPPSRVFLHAARWLSHAEGTSELELTCRGGFYVRSLVRDVARALSSAAHVQALERSAIGPWAAPEPGAEGFVSGDALVPWWPSRLVTDAEWGALRGGAPIPVGPVAAAPWSLPAGFPAPTPLVRALHQGRLVALVREEAGQWLPSQLFQGGL